MILLTLALVSALLSPEASALGERRYDLSEVRVLRTHECRAAPGASSNELLDDPFNDRLARTLDKAARREARRKGYRRCEEDYRGKVVNRRWEGMGSTCYYRTIDPVMIYCAATHLLHCLPEDPEMPPIPEPDWRWDDRNCMTSPLSTRRYG